MAKPPHMRIAPRVTKLARAASWLLLALIVVLSVVPPGLRPVSGAPSLSEHAFIFFLTGTAFALGYGMNRWAFLALAIVFSAAIETLQIFVPGRHARMIDFVIDSIAACLGLTVGWLAAPQIARCTTPLDGLGGRG